MPPPPELDTLRELLEQVERRRPRSAAETLREELARAVELENYEKAAFLRDQLKSLKGLDPRPGGKFNTTMRSEDGTEYPNSGIYLEVTPNRKLVTTDAFTAGWIPSGQPFMVSELTFEPLEGGRTKYTARAMHWNAETKAQHEAMGFHAGWGQCADQLAEVLATV